jgi:hypothetical protein
MFTLKIENTNGEIFELSHNTQNYAVVGVSGLTRPQTAINTSTGGGLDGAFFNSTRVEMRNIVIDIILQGDIETNRQRLYRIFPQKTACTVYFQNKNRNVQISGYVETLGGDLFSQRERMQISIICPRPFWQDMNVIYTELSNVLKMFQFPFAIAETPGVPMSEIMDNPICTVNNSGDVPCGCIITVNIASDAAAGTQIRNLRIYNVTTQEFMGFGTYPFEPGDEITINTLSGQLSATLNRSGTITNLLNWVVSGSSWFKLPVGENRFTFTTANDSEAVDITFETAMLYGGV